MIPIGFFFGGGKRTDQTAGYKVGVGGSRTIAWDDQFKRQNIMWKVPRNVRMNDNVVVREDEIAVFYRDGKVLAYLDRPDRYALTSQNAPILGRLIQALSGVVQQAEVYYLQKRIFDGKFGTQDAFLFQDPDFDMVQLRAFGDFRYRLKDPETFINQFVGTFGAATSAEVEDRIKGEIVKQLNVTLGKMKANGLKVVDFAASLNDIERALLDVVQARGEIDDLEAVRLHLAQRHVELLHDLAFDPVLDLRGGRGAERPDELVDERLGILEAVPEVPESAELDHVEVRVLEQERVLGPELAVEDALLEVVHLRLLHDAGEGLDELAEDRRVLRRERVPVGPVEIGEDLAVAIEDRDLVFADYDVIVHPHVSRDLPHDVLSLELVVPRDRHAPGQAFLVARRLVCSLSAAEEECNGDHRLTPPGYR